MGGFPETNLTAVQRDTALYGLAAYAATVFVAVACMPGMPLVWAFVMIFVTLCAVVGYGASKAQNWQGMIVLFVAAAILSVGVIANVWYYTTCSGGTDHMPDLVNDDCARYWTVSNCLVSLPETARAHYAMYSYVVAALFWVTGPSISAACILSMSLILISLVQLAVTGRRLGLTRMQCTVCMGAMAAVCYWLSTGCTLLKEAWIICAMIVAMRGMLTAVPRWQLGLGMAMLCIGRFNYLGFIVLGLVITAFAVPAGDRRKTLVSRAIWIAVTIIVWYACHRWQNIFTVAQYMGTQSMIQENTSEPSHYAYYALFGDYGGLPLWRKLLLLPVTAGVQFFVPFPWLWLDDLSFGPSFVYAHCGYPGYLFGATVIYFLGDSLIRLCRRRIEPLQGRLLCFAMWGVACWLVPCVMYGGTVSRYGLPALALMAPGVAFTLTNRLRNRGFLIWMALFVLVAAVVLVVAHHLQVSALDGPDPLAS